MKNDKKLLTLWIRIPVLIFFLLLVAMLNVFLSPLFNQIAKTGETKEQIAVSYGLLQGIFALLWIYVAYRICKWKVKIKSSRYREEPSWTIMIDKTTSEGIKIFIDVWSDYAITQFAKMLRPALTDDFTEDKIKAFFKSKKIDIMEYGDEGTPMRILKEARRFQEGEKRFADNIPVNIKFSFYAFGIALILLLLAVLYHIFDGRSLPAGYYTFMRIIVCISSGWFCWLSKKDWMRVMLALCAILYNPVIPIHFYDTDVWMFFNIVTISLLIIGFMFMRKQEKQHGTSSTRKR